ncbi:O-acetyl-ADP-ribose deacetylase [Gottfriedia acidiceleris]|uniref:O-acetyl-ADP-ribose deacetylase n=1 Tax=Gottfriedia acidiceleris TaxID=371036 RepID=A0ABY4JKK0_9BACI|nr:O-acetyl-ADP-ribose deacetylase [Gottfriedia acidiceleris]UPM52850.1 O-acetyl-ADP-ribose deacetylase [Gottfriedia acidiceleris]
MGEIKVIKGDITKQTVDAVVNAANSSLLGGGGVDGAIHRAAGKGLYEECVAIRNKQGGCQTGAAVITTGGNLLAKYVIHTVGPVWNAGNKNEDVLLRSCYLNSLDLARTNGIETIAFPNISTGIYGYPKIPAAQIAVKTVNEYLENNEGIKEVVFVCFDEENYQICTNIN